MFIFYEFRPFLYRQRARYLSKNTVYLDGYLNKFFPAAANA